MFHLPVVDPHFGLQGMVSRRDVLRGLVEHYQDWRRREPEGRNVPDISTIFTPRFVLG